jgi:hypothetical protein
MVLIRKMGERDWHAPASSAYRDEAGFEALLEEAPSLLPGPDDDKPLVVERVQAQEGSVDPATIGWTSPARPFFAVVGVAPPDGLPGARGKPHDPLAWYAAN